MADKAKARIIPGEIFSLQKDRMVGDPSAPATTTSSPVLVPGATLKEQLDTLSNHKMGLTAYTALSNSLVFLAFVISHGLSVHVGILIAICVFTLFVVAFLLSKPLLGVTNSLLALLPANN